MRKRIIFIFCPLVLIFVLTGFRNGSSAVSEVPDALKVSQPTEVLLPSSSIEEEILIVYPPFLGNSYVGFKEALAFKESQGDYFVTNILGHLGKYQFGVTTLQLMGVHNPKGFLNSPELQEKVFHVNIARNKWILRKDINRFSGQRISGVVVTESGILAAAHLAGAGNVKKYLRSYGQIDFEDTFGTSMAYYMNKFSGYDVSFVSPKRNAKI